MIHEVCTGLIELKNQSMPMYLNLPSAHSVEDGKDPVTIQDGTARGGGHARLSARHETFEMASVLALTSILTSVLLGDDRLLAVRMLLDMALYCPGKRAVSL